MIEQLQIRIVRVPSGGGLKEAAVIMMVPSLDVPTADLFLRFAQAPPRCRAREDIAAIVSTGLLNSPDTLSATGGRAAERMFEIDLEICAFDGPLAANDPSIALLRMELGSLERGAYELVVRTTVSRFTDRQQPERGTNPTAREERLQFHCE